MGAKPLIGNGCSAGLAARSRPYDVPLQRSMWLCVASLLHPGRQGGGANGGAATQETSSSMLRDLPSLSIPVRLLSSRPGEEGLRCKRLAGDGSALRMIALTACASSKPIPVTASFMFSCTGVPDALPMLSESLGSRISMPKYRVGDLLHRQ